ncbi:hypothetical protein KIPB_014155, partial [Kipferlia bialata]
EPAVSNSERKKQALLSNLDACADAIYRQVESRGAEGLSMVEVRDIFPSAVRGQIPANKRAANTIAERFPSLGVKTDKNTGYSVLYVMPSKPKTATTTASACVAERERENRAGVPMVSAALAGTCRPHSEVAPSVSHHPVTSAPSSVSAYGLLPPYPLQPEHPEDAPSLDDRLSLLHTATKSLADSADVQGMLSSPLSFMLSGRPPSLLSRPVSAVLGPDSEGVSGRGLLGMAVSTSAGSEDRQEQRERENRYAALLDESDSDASEDEAPSLLWLNTRDPFAAVVRIHYLYIYTI